MYREPRFLPWDGRRVPITFVGGYLGAGKTTAINEVIASTDRPVAVIVNDVGSISIDAALIRQRHGDTIELSDGCVCCSSIDGLGAAFDQIRSRPRPPDHVIIELSGVADPRQMLPWGQSAGFMLDGVVVVVAADQLIEDALPSWVRAQLMGQITAADLLVLTKTDLVDSGVAAAARAQLADLAPNVAIFEGGRDLAHPGAVGRFLALGARSPVGAALVPDSTLFDAHQTGVLAVPAALTIRSLEAWVHGLPAQVEGHLVRAKGIVETIDSGLVLVQVVGSRCELTVLTEPERQAPTDLVVISLRSPVQVNQGNVS